MGTDNEGRSEFGGERMKSLLRQARESRGLTVEEVAAQFAGPGSVAELRPAYVWATELTETTG